MVKLVQSFLYVNRFIRFGHVSYNTAAKTSVFGQRQSNWEKWAILLLYALFTGFVIHRHEPYFDELHAWVIVLQSNSVAALHVNKVYEGHPDAWYYLLYAISQFTTDFVWVQFAQWAMSVAAMSLLVRYAPFKLPVIGLLLFSYLFGYEYVAISRNYMIGIVLLFTVCSLFTYRYKPVGYLSICLVLTLLLQTSAMTALVCCALYGTLLLEVLVYKPALLRSNWLFYLSGVVVVLAGLVLLYVSVLPPADVNLYWIDTTLTVERFFWSITYFVNAFVQIPANSWYFWNTSVLDNITNRELQLMIKCGIAFGLVGLVLLPLLHSRLAAIGWIAACMTILFILYTQYPGIFRHHGHFFIAFVCFLWIQPQLADYRKTSSRSSEKVVQRANKAWLSLLVLQVTMALFAGYQDIRRPFSMNKQVVDFINDQYKGYFLVGYLDHIGESVAAYIPGFRMYYPSSGRQDGYLKNDSKVRFRTLAQIVDSVHVHQTGPALLLLNGKMREGLTDSLGLVPVRFFVGSILGDEQFMIYKLK